LAQLRVGRSSRSKRLPWFWLRRAALAEMLAPDLQFMVHSSEVVDEEGYAHRGSRIALVERGSALPPEWRLRDFAFAAYGGCHAAGLRQVQLGRWAIWGFSSPREHCEEIVVFRKGTDTRRKWNEDALDDPKAGLDMFFIMRARQITTDTPLGRQFNGEWGFWESFYVPVLDEQQTMEALLLMDPAMVEDHFTMSRLPVTCHRCPEGRQILTVSDDYFVKYEVKIACKSMEEWSDLCTKIGDDMIMQEACIVEHKHLKPGDECIEAYHEQTGIEDHARLIKRDFEQLKLPVIATFRCNLRVVDWEQDMISLRYKFDFTSGIYTGNLMGGFTSMSGAKSDPWNPNARLAINALNKVMARWSDIRTVLDLGCGDMAWMKYFLQENPVLSYVGVDINPCVMALNFKSFPKLQFLQTDLSNLSGIEIMPQGCDLVIAKDVFNHMTLPDAISAIKRVTKTRPRFLLTHVHGAADNSGWEKRIDKHLHYTRYDYNKPPFSLPFPAVEIQRISEEAYFVLYEITPEGASAAPARIDRLRPPIPPAAGLNGFSLVADGEWAEPVVHTSKPSAPAASPGIGQQAKTETGCEADKVATPQHIGERTNLTTPVTELPDKLPDAGKIAPERKPIKGLPPVEFRARCDLIFDKFDLDKDAVLCFEEVAALMEAGGRKVETREAFQSLCSRLGCDAAVGLDRKDLYKFFEKAPQPLWEEVYRSIDPLAGMLRKGADSLPETFLERPLSNFLFEDDEQFAILHVELNAHMFYGAAEAVTQDSVQAFFGTRRMELHICAPGAFGGKDLYKWRLVVSPLSQEVVADDCQLEFKETTGRFGSKKITIKLMKAKPKKWYKIGQATTGQQT